MIRKESWHESGGYVEKGPFPKITTVLVQEIDRDEILM